MPSYKLISPVLIQGPEKVTLTVQFVTDAGLESSPQYFEVDSTKEVDIRNILSEAAISFQDNSLFSPIAAVEPILIPLNTLIAAEFVNPNI